MTIDVRQEWETPADFWEVVESEFSFELDACANATNRQCPRYWNLVDDGLTQDWLPRTWCNPGFKNVYPWLLKAREEACRFGRESQIVVMGLTNPSTDVWYEQGLQASEIRLLSPRVQFVAPAGVKQTSNPRENALFIYRWNPHCRPPDIWTWRWKG